MECEEKPDIRIEIRWSSIFPIAKLFKDEIIVGSVDDSPGE
jgi:hypothetical protein